MSDQTTDNDQGGSPNMIGGAKAVQDRRANPWKQSEDTRQPAPDADWADSDRQMLISAEYARTLRATHAQYQAWGNGHGARNLHKVLPFLPSPRAAVLDYGCGKGTLVHALRAEGISADGYDPGVAEWSALPEDLFDLLVSFDVLEHIEPAMLDEVLRHMHYLAPSALVNVSLVLANRILTDGRNSHLIVQPAHWWEAQLLTHWRRATLVSASEKEASWLLSR